MLAIYHPRAFGSASDYYHPYPANRRSCGSYYNVFPDARALAQQLEEEALTSRRLQQFRQSRQTHYHNGGWSPLPDVEDRRLEALRLQLAEEEQLAKLEALRKRRRQLEEQERLRAAADLRKRQAEAEALAQRERMTRLRELAIAEEEEQLRRLTQRINTNKSLFGPRQHDTRYAHSRRVHRQTPPDPMSLFLKFVVDEPVLQDSAHDTKRQAATPVPKDEPCNKPPTASGELDFSALLQQLGLLPPSAVHPQTSQEAKPAAEQPKTQTSPDICKARNVNENKPSPSPTSKAPAALSPEATLKEQLEKRLEGEYANEIRDTITAILNSLSDISSGETSGLQKSSSQASTPSSSVATGKGKAKEVPKPDPEPVALSGNDVDDIMTQLEVIEAQFHSLEEEFEFPEKLDFSAPSSTAPDSRPSSPSPIASQLSFTATNHRVRYYEQSLSGLLSLLDSIESHGNDMLRSKRKEVVRKVENALEELEQRVEARWQSQLVKTAKRRSVTIEDVTNPEEHLMVPGNVPTPEAPSVPASRSTAFILSATGPQESENPVLSGLASPDEGSQDIVEEVVDSLAARSVVDKVEVTADQTTQPTQGSPEETPILSHNATNSLAASTNFDSQSMAHPEVTTAFVSVPLASTLETTSAQIITAPEPNLSEDSSMTGQSVTTSTSSPSPLAGVEQATVTDSSDNLSQPEPDLAATLRPLANVTSVSGELTTSPGTSKSAVESDLSDSEAEGEGVLLENGVVEAERDVSDTESATSDWSEVDAAH